MRSQVIAGLMHMAKSKGAAKSFEYTAEKFAVAIDIFPPVAMIRDNALQLAQALSQHHELTDIHMSDEKWEFRRPQAKQGQPRSAIEVTVENQEIRIEHQSPIGGLERFETLLNQVLDAIHTVIKPGVLLGTTVELEYLVDIGGDAREAILRSLGLIGEEEEEEADKLRVFDRPCHQVGLRLVFPPFIVEEDEPEKDDAEDDGPIEELPERGTAAQKGKSGEKAPELQGVNWQAILTLQSLQDEPSKFSVEVVGRWVDPVAWQPEIFKTIPQCVRGVDEFLKTKINDFLQHFRSGT